MKVNKNSLLFMLVGLSGSGKSTFARSIFSETDEAISKPVIHSSDALREELYGDIYTQSHNNKIFSELHRRIKRDLSNGNNVVYDATNIKKKYRRAFLNELTRIDCHKVCVCILTPYDVCLKQNHDRERKVSENVIRRMYLNWTPPSLDEGFEDIIFEYNYGCTNADISIAKNRYSLKNFF